VCSGRDKREETRGKRVVVIALGLCAACLMLSSAVAWAETVRDPTRPPAAVEPVRAAPQPPARNYILQSTRVSEERRSAVINGRVVVEGDQIGGARVLGIEQARVRLRDARGEFSLALAVPKVTRPAQAREYEYLETTSTEASQ